MSMDCTVDLAIAKELLVKKNLYGFGGKIAVIKHIAQSNGDQNLYWKAFQEEVKSLQCLRNYVGLLQIISEAKDAVTQPERNARLRYLEGVSLGELGEYTNARKVFQVLVGQEEIGLSAMGQIGLSWLDTLLYAETGDEAQLAAAEWRCQKVLQLDNAQELYILALQVLGSIHLYQRRYKMALAVLRQAQDLLTDENPGVLNNIAIAYLCSEDLEQATQYVERAEIVALKDGDQYQEAQSYLIRGRIEEELVQDYTRAKDYYLVSYDKFLEAASVKDALLVLQRVSNVDQQVSRENVNALARYLGIRFAQSDWPGANWGQGVEMGRSVLQPDLR